MVDRAVRDVLQEAEERALQVVRRSREPLARLVARLEREETLDAEQIEACLGRHPGRRRGRVRHASGVHPLRGHPIASPGSGASTFSSTIPAGRRWPGAPMATEEQRATCADAPGTVGTPAWMSSIGIEL